MEWQPRVQRKRTTKRNQPSLGLSKPVKACPWQLGLLTLQSFYLGKGRSLSGPHRRWVSGDQASPGPSMPSLRIAAGSSPQWGKLSQPPWRCAVGRSKVRSWKGTWLLLRLGTWNCVALSCKKSDEVTTIWRSQARSLSLDVCSPANIRLQLHGIHSE